MSPAVERLKSEIASLSADERVELADFLMATLSPDDERAWLVKCQGRDAELDRGNVQGIPANRVFDRLRAKYSPSRLSSTRAQGASV